MSEAGRTTEKTSSRSFPLVSVALFFAPAPQSHFLYVLFAEKTPEFRAQILSLGRWMGGGGWEMGEGGASCNSEDDKNNRAELSAP